jgi:hypothetical protein
VKASGGKTVLDGFQYSSDANPVWMTGDQLKALLGREIIET